MAPTTLTATYVKPDGTPEQGFVEFAISTTSYQDASDRIITKSPVRVDMDETGAISVDLEPTSGADADWFVGQMSYKVTERAVNERGKTVWTRKYGLDVPTSATPLELGDLTTWASAPSAYITRFPAGATGARPLTSDVAVGTTFFDTTLGQPIWSDGSDWVDATGTPA